MNMNAYVSPYTGFSFTTTGFENQVASITSVIEQYRPSFANGLYTEDYYNEFISRLEDAGVNEYIAHIQEEFDAWLAENGDAAASDSASTDTAAAEETQLRQLRNRFSQPFNQQVERAGGYDFIETVKREQSLK